MSIFHAIEKITRAELRTLQLERMRESLARAYRGNAHYRAKFDAARVTPHTLRSLEDLRHFPFTTKADLRENYPLGLCSVPQTELARIHASSGTTGRPTVVGYTRGDIDTWAQLVARSIHAAGGRPGMKAHIAYGYGLFTGGLGAHYGAEALGCTVIPMSGGQTEKQVRLIEDFRPEIIMVTPSYMLAILDEYRRQGLDPAKSSLKVGICGAEPWSDGMREEIERAFGIDALDIYGLSEVMGPGVAQECVATKDGPTIWEDHFYPEIIDPETGDVLPDGEEGELVLTTLSKVAMPVIRYRTRDLTRLLPGTARTMRRMARITGRTDDMLIVRGVNLFPSQIEEQLLKCAALTPHYQIELQREQRLDTVKLRVEGRNEALSHAVATDIDRLAGLIKTNIGITIQVELSACGSLPRSHGKANRVMDLRR